MLPELLHCPAILSTEAVDSSGIRLSIHIQPLARGSQVSSLALGSWLLALTGSWLLAPWPGLWLRKKEWRDSVRSVLLTLDRRLSKGRGFAR